MAEFKKAKIQRRRRGKTTKEGVDPQLVKQLMAPHTPGFVNNGKGINEKKLRPVVIQPGQNYSFVRPQALHGLGKYDVTRPGEAERQRNKKKEYKKKAKEAESGSWWDSLCKHIPAAISTVAPMIMKGLTGFGDYEVNANTILAGATSKENGSELPLMMNTKVANVIRHREFIGNVLGSTAEFSPVFYNINPGLDETFPWLYLIANCFSSYRLLGMVLEFKSLASDYTTSTYLGFVVMGTQYNSLEIPFPDKETMENSEYSNSCKPSRDLLHPVECSPQQQVLTQLYIRSGAIPANADLKMYDLGRFCIATGGQTANGIIGELWATYEVELYQPKLSRNFGATINFDHWQTLTDSATSLLPFGTDATQAAGGTMLGSRINPSGATYFFPPGEASGSYRIWYRISSATLTTLVAPIWSYVNCVQKVMIRGFNQYQNAAASPQTGIVGTLSYTYLTDVALTGTNATVTIGVAGTLPPGGVDFMVSQIPSAAFDEDDWKQKYLRGFKDHAFDKVSITNRFEKIKKEVVEFIDEDSEERPSKQIVGKKLKLLFVMKKSYFAKLSTLFPRVPDEVLQNIVEDNFEFPVMQNDADMWNTLLFCKIRTLHSLEEKHIVLNSLFVKEEKGVIYVFAESEDYDNFDYIDCYWNVVNKAPFVSNEANSRKMGTLYDGTSST
jgi:hypothetical protein